MKKFKNVLIALIFVPCLLFFAACGGNKADAQFKTKAKIDTEGEYTETSKEELTTYLSSGATPEAQTLKTSMSGYRLTGSIEMPAMPELGLTEATTTNFDVIYVGGEKLEDYKMAMKMSAKDEKAYMYIKDGYVYANVEDEKLKAKITTDEQFDEIQTSTSQLVSLEEMIELITTMEEGATVKVAVDGNTKKYEVTLDLSGLAEEGFGFENLVSEYKMYFVFENDILTGFTVSYNSIMGSSCTLTMENYNGKVVFPSFKDYKEVNFDEIMAGEVE